MRRDLQQNEIRTNICFEFNVIGANSAYQLQKDIMSLATKYAQEGINTARLVGLTLRKPTASNMFLTLANVMLAEGSSSTTESEQGSEDSEVEDEEVSEDDQESDRND